MARFDVYRMEGGELVIDCQADLLDEIDTRFVIPLLVPDAIPIKFKRLNPIFQVEGTNLVMVPQLALSVRRGSLRERVASLSDHHTVILDAIDFLLNGF